MTEKRFTIILDYDDEIGVKENRSGDVVVLNHRDLNSEQFVAQLVMFLNEQNDAIEKLIKDEKYWEQKAIERITELEQENKKLKKECTELHEWIDDICERYNDQRGIDLENDLE